MNSNPRLLISNYYESIIREIDIFVEERLIEFNDNGNDDETNRSIELNMNRTRDEMIDEVKRAEHETFELYEMKLRNELTSVKNEASTINKLDYLESRLFANNSVVFVSYALEGNRSELCLLIFDVYLNKTERELLKFF